MTTWLFEPTTDGTTRPGSLDITLRFDGAVTVCVLEGPLCAYTAPILDGWLDQLADNSRHRVIVDLEDVATLSSDGVDVLVHHANQLRRAGGALQVRGASDVAHRVLEICDAGVLVEDAAR